VFYDSVINGKNSMPAWGDVLLPGEIELLWYYKTSAQFRIFSQW
jgi:hypothetical protein